MPVATTEAILNDVWFRLASSESFFVFGQVIRPTGPTSARGSQVRLEARTQTLPTNPTHAP